jgi:hypothetical protein
MKLLTALHLLLIASAGTSATQQAPAASISGNGKTIDTEEEQFPASSEAAALSSPISVLSTGDTPGASSVYIHGGDKTFDTAKSLKTLATPNLPSAMRTFEWSPGANGNSTTESQKKELGAEVVAKFMALYEAGTVLRGNGQFLEAYEKFDEADQTIPGQAQIQIYKALAMLALGKTRDAGVLFDRAVEILPGDPGAHYLRGGYRLDCREFALAREDFLAAQAKYPANDEGRVAGGHWLV